MQKNKMTSILLSLVIAFGMWLYVVTTVSQEHEDTYFNVPVVLTGESVLTENDLMITSDKDFKVSLTISGNRSELSKINSGNITVTADVKGIEEEGENIPLTYKVSYPGDVAENSLVVESRNPQYVYVDVEKRINNKPVPVEIIWEGATPEGFMCDKENRLLDVEEILITGPASVAEQIEKAVITVDLDDQRGSISQDYRYTLCDAEGNAVDAEQIVANVAQIHLDVTIQMVKELPLRLDVIYGAGTSQDNTTITIEPETIRLAGGEAVLENLGESITLGKIDLSLIEKSQSTTFPITLPEGVTNLSGITEAVVTIRFAGLTTREFTVDNILITNVPEGMTADVITEKLTVVLRGTPTDLANITEEDITATVDFTGAEADTATFKVSISCSEEYPNVGAVGTYTTSATVQQE